MNPGHKNVFFMIDDQVITPSVHATTMPGITRDSALKLLSEWGAGAEKREMSIQEIADAR